MKGKLENKFAYTTFWLRVFFAVSGFPSLVVSLLGGVSPFFRQVSTIRWAETILQLNSLFNPILYWYRNRRFREAILELLRCRKRPEARTARRIRQRRYSVASLDVEKLQNEQRGARLLRSESVGAMMSLDTFRQRRNEAVKERPLSAPTRVTSGQIFRSKQCNKLIVTVQIENVPRGKGIHQNIKLHKNTTELGRSRCHTGGKIVMRSTSVNENSFVPLANSHGIAPERFVRRSKSVPILSTKAMAH